MAVITVNGTSIQTAINAAAVDDEIRVKNNGTYAPFDITKRLKVIADSSPFKVFGPGPSTNVIQVRANGATLAGVEAAGATAQYASCIGVVNVADVTLDHVTAYESAAGYGIRMYGAPTVRTRLISPIVHHVAAGIQFHRGGAGSVVSDPVIYDTDRMLVNDPTSGTDAGGAGMVFYHSTGPITVERPMFTRCYSKPRDGKPASYDYGWDGGHFESFGSATGVTVIGGELRESPWVLETGINPGDTSQSNFTFRGVKVWGMHTGQAPQVTEFGETYYKANGGFLLRSINGFLLEDCEFRNMDWHLLLLEKNGNYATGAVLDNVVARRNKVWLKTGDNRWFSIGANVAITPTLFTSSDNQIYTQSGGTVVYVQGRGKTSDLNTFKSWAPSGATWEQNSYWGAETVTPPPDPCTAITAERDAALAQLATANAALSAANATITTLTNERNTARSERDAANAKLAQAKSLAGQITVL